MKAKQLSQIIAIMALAIVFTGCTTDTDVQGTNTTTSTSLSTSTMTADNSKADKYESAPEVLPEDQLQNRVATIKTSKGNIELELYGEIAPKTVSNFIFLIEEDFYDGLIFHRREPGFVIQGGDPTGTGAGGPGYTVEAEISTEATHIKGALATARQSDFVNPEKRSSGSQFYITLDETPFLDGEYTVFGKVTSGMDVVEQIEVGDVIEDITIN